MATSNVFVLSEQPPLLGKISSSRAGAQIREFLTARKRYNRRHSGGTVVLPSLQQLMEEDDLEQIRVIMTARFTKEDRERYPVEYVQRDTEEESDLEEEESDSEEGSDEEDLARLAGIQAREVFTERKKSASRVGNLSRGMSKNKRDSESTVRISSSEKIKKRREQFEREIFEEKNLLEALRYIFGPKNLVQGVEALRAIRMESNSLPYRSLQESAEYVAHFQETLEWVGDFKPSSKMVKQLFIKGVQPKELQEELSLREIKSLEVLQDTFAEIFYENYSSIQRLGAAGAMRGDEKKTDTGTRVRDTQGKTGFTRDGGSFRKGMIWTPKRDEDQRTPAGGPAPVTPKKTGDKLAFYAIKRDISPTLVRQNLAGAPERSCVMSVTSRVIWLTHARPEQEVSGPLE
jgi:hypothetical protein